MDCLRRHSLFINAVAACKPDQAKAIVKTATKTQLNAICEILLNIVRGTLKISEGLLKKLKKFKKVIRLLSKRCTKSENRKKLIVKYMPVIKKILNFIIPVCGLALSTAGLLK